METYSRAQHGLQCRQNPWVNRKSELTFQEKPHFLDAKTRLKEQVVEKCRRFNEQVQQDQTLKLQQYLTGTTEDEMTDRKVTEDNKEIKEIYEYFRNDQEVTNDDVQKLPLLDQCLYILNSASELLNELQLQELEMLTDIPTDRHLIYRSKTEPHSLLYEYYDITENYREHSW